MSLKPLGRWRDCLVAALLAMTTQVHAAVADGYVVRVDSAVVYLDWGAASGAKMGDRFSVYRKGEVLKHPVTGEVLGHAEEAVGIGSLQNIESKFSVGQLHEIKKAPRVGDRTRWRMASLALEPEAVIASATAMGQQAASLTPAAPTLQELWRSDPLEKDAVGITFSDLDGDGKKEIIVAYRKKIQAYRLKDKRLEPFASFDSRSYRNWLAVDAIDLKKEGREDIFATVFIPGIARPRTVVLRFEAGVFKRVGELDGFVRTLQRLDGSRHLYWQGLSLARELRYTAVSEMAWEKGSYRPGPPLNLKLFDDQLFGFAWGDWDKDAGEDLAVLEHGERIRLYLKDTKWKSNEVYGGTKNDFSYDERPVGSYNPTGSLYPKLLSWRASQGDRDQLIVPRNIPGLGVRLTYLKIYKQSEVLGMIWNGLEMQRVWRIPIEGYLADFAIDEVMGESRPQLWVAAVGPGDKTVLLSYSLP